ncbi:MAG: type 4a pilus biogenesis protein PilO [Mariprofundales bacterium]|nr:type 4a pilus biogenesis protein PilO [Mariprofundales bacterium]
MKLDQINLALLDPLRPILPAPMWQKVLGLVVLCIVLPLGGYGGLVWQGMLDEMDTVQQAIRLQRVVLVKNRKLAADLPRKKKEYAKLQQQLRVALNLLPKKAEIPDLLESVSWAGRDAGLEFSAFKPMGERKQGIYAEVPVSLSMAGSYKQMVEFIRQVGELPRIVNVNALSIRGQGDKLRIQGRATTYRFLEPAKKPSRKPKR